MRLEPPRVTPGLVLAVFGGIMLAVVLRERAPDRPPHQLGGIVMRGSLVSPSPTEHHFRLFVEWHDVAGLEAREVSVHYRGIIPDTLCEGREVFVRGRLVGDRVEAAQVLGAGASKYDACAHPCRGEPPPGCPRRDLFQ